MIDGILSMINDQLGHPTVVRALVLSWLISVGLTQLAKFSPQLDATRDSTYRLFTRLFAFLAAFVPCWALWPRADSIAGICAAICMGLLSPTIYAIVVKVLVWKWPSLDSILSGRPDPDLHPPKA